MEGNNSSTSLVSDGIFLLIGRWSGSVEVSLSFLIQLQTNINQCVSPAILGNCCLLYYHNLAHFSEDILLIATLLLAISNSKSDSFGSLRYHLVKCKIKESAQ